jgi:hypothetical protein
MGWTRSRSCRRTPTKRFVNARVLKISSPPSTFCTGLSPLSLSLSLSLSLTRLQVYEKAVKIIEQFFSEADETEENGALAPNVNTGGAFQFDASGFGGAQSGA